MNLGPSLRGSNAIAPRASLVDRESGVRRVIKFFGPHSLKLFGSLHIPPATPQAGLVVCSPVLAEHTRNYRREFLLAENLACRGVAVLRFHYRGTGHSDGDDGVASLETMCEDALVAAEHLTQTTGATPITVLGTRLSALVAAQTAAHLGNSPLALWEPVIDPSRYFREIFRGYLMTVLKDGVAAGTSTQALSDQLERGGDIDISGYPVSGRLYRSFHDHTLTDTLGDKPRSLFLAQMSGRRELRTEYARAAEALRSRGFSVEAGTFTHLEGWWLGGERARDRSEIDRLVDSTATWLLGRLRDKP